MDHPLSRGPVDGVDASESCERTTAKMSGWLQAPLVARRIERVSEVAPAYPRFRALCEKLPGSGLGCGEPLLQVGQDVVDVLDAHSQPHQTRSHAGTTLGLW